MGKNIKDYLHLYLGCEILDLYDNRVGRLFMCSIAGEEPCSVLHNVVHHRNYEEVKPILRPLSDMTEEEMNECGNLDYDFSDDEELNKWDWQEFSAMLTANQFLYLLSKHFDLFGLIEAGLSIDKTTLK